MRRTEGDVGVGSVGWELVEKFRKRTRRIEQLARDKYKVLEAQARALMKSTNMAFDDAFAHVIAEIGGDWDKWESRLGSKNPEKKDSAIHKSKPQLKTTSQTEQKQHKGESSRPEPVETGTPRK